jgi:hypothetical protein
MTGSRRYPRGMWVDREGLAHGSLLADSAPLAPEHSCAGIPHFAINLRNWSRKRRIVASVAGRDSPHRLQRRR